MDNTKHFTPMDARILSANGWIIGEAVALKTVGSVTACASATGAWAVGRDREVIGSGEEPTAVEAAMMARTVAYATVGAAA